jgi:predicted transposase YbfD/YdcC
LPFVLACTLVAILSNRSFMSSIHRYIQNHIEWLKEVFECSDVTAVSRAQLPNILASVDWEALNGIFKDVFGLCIAHDNTEWKAVDGKSLKGTIADASQAHDHERIVTVVGHTSHDVLEQQRFSGAKESEVTVVRDLLEHTGLNGEQLSLDAGHAYPDTLEPIEQAGGLYVVQIKQNQPQLFKALAHLAEQAEQKENQGEPEQVKPEDMNQQKRPQEETTLEETTPEEQPELGTFPVTGVVITTVDKGHGRLEERTGRVLSLAPHRLDPRWEATGMKTFIVMDRKTEHLKTGKTSEERSYYVSNQVAAQHEQELFAAIRGHWRVESMNCIRDVTFNEDRVRTKNPKTGQILSSLRTIALTLVQSLHPKNIKAKLEEFVDTPEALLDLLVRFNLASGISAS